MPELPEVETIVRDLRRDLIGQKIESVRFLNRTVWRKRAPSQKEIVGATVDRVERRGKHILVFHSNGRVLIVHLKMTGRLTFEQPSTAIKKHTHLVINLDSGQLRFNDIRRFGYLDLVRETDIGNLGYLAALGPDALVVPRDEFTRLLRSKKRIIKSLLMDQNFLAGMGNIYSDEALFLAGINPRRVSSAISGIRAGRLYDAMIEILKRAIDSRGSSMNDYVDARGQKGSFQIHHLVYGKEGKPCPRCGRKIRRQVIGSRSAHFCPGCQR